MMLSSIKRAHYSFLVVKISRSWFGMLKQALKSSMKSKCTSRLMRTTTRTIQYNTTQHNTNTNTNKHKHTNTNTNTKNKTNQSANLTDQSINMQHTPAIASSSSHASGSSSGGAAWTHLLIKTQDGKSYVVPAHLGNEDVSVLYSLWLVACGLWLVILIRSPFITKKKKINRY